MSQENVDLVRRQIEAYNRRDFDELRRFNHPDIEVDWSASRGLEPLVYRGQDDVIGFYRGLLDMFDHIRIEPDRFIEAGDAVVVPNTAYARGRDGIETVAHSAVVFEVRGGVVARICLYQETHEALEAVGLWEWASQAVSWLALPSPRRVRARCAQAAA